MTSVLISFYILQGHPCHTLDKVNQDESYAAYIMGNPIDCEEYQECKVVEVPQVIDRALGAGWLFPKRSPSQPLFDGYIKNIVENYAMLSQAGSFVELLFISSLHYPMRNSSDG